MPAALEPWAAGPGGGGVALGLAATLGEVREVATLRHAAGSEAVAEVWLERARRPARRLVVRAGGAVFADASTLGGFRDRGMAVASGAEASTPGPAPAQASTSTQPLPRGGASPGVGGDDPLFAAAASEPATPASPALDAEPPAGAGLRWERWKRLPTAEADLLNALDPPRPDSTVPK